MIRRHRTAIVRGLVWGYGIGILAFLVWYGQ